MRCLPRRGVGALLGTAALTAAALVVPAGAAPVSDPRPDALEPCTYSTSSSDLNGDGFDDTVVGNPDATVAGRVAAGSVTVLFGDADGRIGEGVRRVITQADGGSRPEAGDRFGAAVAVADADGCAEILVGSPGEDGPAGVDMGIAQIVRFAVGDEGEPTTTTGFTFTQSQVGGRARPGDEFGASVVLDRYRDDQPGTGFVGAPGTSVRGVPDAGTVSSFAIDRRAQRVIFGSTTASPPGGGRFGSSLALATVGVDEVGEIVQRRHLLIGSPGATVGGHRGAGAVWGLQVGGREPGTQTLLYASQDSGGVDGVAEAGDGFGAALAVTGAGSGVIVGSPGEDVGQVRDAGMVHVFATTDPNYPGLRQRLSLTQNADGLGSAETGDAFGAAVADGYDGFFVGVPGEDVGPKRDVGAVSSGQFIDTSVEDLRTTTLDSPGVPGRTVAGDRYGAVIGAQAGLAEEVVTVARTRSGAGSVVVFSNRFAVRSWAPGRSGVPTQDGRFGLGLPLLSGR